MKSNIGTELQAPFANILRGELQIKCPASQTTSDVYILAFLSHLSFVSSLQTK
jgi:hypothetical protein